MLGKVSWEGTAFWTWLLKTRERKNDGQVGDDQDRRNGGEGWGNGTHSHSQSSPQTHPNLPGAAAWLSHSGWWGWPGLWQQGSWTRRWIMPLSSSEGRRLAEGLRFLGSHRLPAGFLSESLRNLEREAKHPRSLTAPLLAASSLLNYYVLFWRGMHNLYLIPRKHQTSQTEGTSRK